MPNAPFITEARVALDVHARSTKHLLDLAASQLALDLPHLSVEPIFDALLARERLGTTAIGGGVALPHGRLALVQAPTAAVLRLDEPLDMGAADGRGVDLVIVLLVPDRCNERDIAVLSDLVQDFSDTHFITALRHAASARAVLELLTDPARAAA
jgi:PTS system nitrogen regulatory IIA component